jgi:hypothetical protein
MRATTAPSSLSQTPPPPALPDGRHPQVLMDRVLLVAPVSELERNRRRWVMQPEIRNAVSRYRKAVEEQNWPLAWRHRQLQLRAQACESLESGDWPTAFLNGCIWANRERWGRDSEWIPLPANPRGHP